MKEESKIFLGVGIGCTIIIILYSIMFWLIIGNSMPPHPPHYFVNFNQTKIEDGYLLEIDICSPNQIKPNGFVW